MTVLGEVITESEDDMLFWGRENQTRAHHNIDKPEHHGNATIK